MGLLAHLRAKKQRSLQREAELSQRRCAYTNRGPNRRLRVRRAPTLVYPFSGKSTSYNGLPRVRLRDPRLNLSMPFGQVLSRRHANGKLHLAND